MADEERRPLEQTAFSMYIVCLIKIFDNSKGAEHMSEPRLFCVHCFFFSFCNFRNLFGINFNINMVLSLLRTPHVLCSLLFFVFYLSRSGFASMLIVDLFVYSVAIDSCTNFVFMYLVPIFRWFLHYPMEKSRLLFFLS